MDQKHALRIVLALFVMLPFSSPTKADPTPAPDTTTGIEGVVTMSPIGPGPTRQDVPDFKPVAKTEFVVQNEKGIVTTFTTDDEGKFKISLPAGHYSVLMKGRRIGVGRTGPFEVDVAAGKMTTVKWDIDTGLR